MKRHHMLKAHLIFSFTILLSAGVPVFSAGASVPFITLEAESGVTTNGAVIHTFLHGSPVPRLATLELEASGGSYVALMSKGASVSWNNPVAGANTLVIRNSIPDAPDGGGIESPVQLYVDGVLRQTIILSSKQSWIYRTEKRGWINDPRGGMPFKFYNESRVKIDGPALAKNSVIALVKESESEQPVIIIDCIDVEAVAPPLPQPENSLSVIDFGALADGSGDSQNAIESCIQEARAVDKTVWIPAGFYELSFDSGTGLDFTGVTVCGAGMWHTTLYKKPQHAPEKKKRSYIKIGAKTTLRDIYIDTDGKTRGHKMQDGSDYALLAVGEHWLVERVWTHHSEPNWMSGSYGIIRSCRSSDHWADGINLNNGNTPDGLHDGQHLQAINNFVRGAGDDGIATFSDAGKGGSNVKMTGCRIISNTAIASYWANGIRVAGGIDVIVRDNLVTDPAGNSGMHIGIFGATSHPLESALIENNVILRVGGWNTTNRHGMVIEFTGVEHGAVTVRSNVIRDSRRAGMVIDGKNVNLIIEGNSIIHPAHSGIVIKKGTTGILEISNNSITDLLPGQLKLTGKAAVLSNNQN